MMKCSSKFSITPIFAWYDIWIGVFIDTKKNTIYFFPIPMFGLKISWQKNTGFVKYDDMEVRLSQSQALDYMPISEEDIKKAIDYLVQPSVEDETCDKTTV